MSQPHKNRTIICSVVFLDIVSYSQLTVSRQHRVKSVFNAVVGETITRVPEDERFVLDTGDGAALCFIGDPEDALFIAMDLRNAFGEVTVDGEPYPGLRIGINLGPVRAVEDLSGRMNLIGDGINVGQRIMSFCDPNQILVSRSYFEVVGCLSQKHAALFRYDGVRQDKHVREHVVYEVFLGDDGAATAGESTVVAEPEPLEIVEPLDLDPAEIERAEKALTALIGPLARVLVRRAAESSADEEAFFRTLASAIAEGTAREAFMAQFAGVRRAKAKAPEHATGAAHERALPGVAKPSAAQGTERLWTEAEAQLFEDALARAVGPLAKILVRKAVQRCESYAELESALAAEIADPNRRAEFLREVRS